MQDFRNLRVWRRAHSLSLRVDSIVDRFPRRAANLRGQLSRAADSIATNISEGCAAASQREFARFLDMAIKSSSETDYHLLKAHDRGLIPRDRYQKEADEISQIRRMLHALRKKVLADLDEGG